MTEWLYNLDSWQLASIILMSCLLSSLAMVAVAHRYFHVQIKDKYELISLFSSSSGVLYSVLLAMITVNAWGNFNQLELIVEDEAYSLGDIYRDVEGYPGPVRHQMRTQLRRYADTVLNEEWPLLNQGKTTQAVRPITDHLFRIASRFVPENAGQAVVHKEVFEKLNSVAHFHRQRVSAVEQSVIPILWLVVWAGAGINLAINALSLSGHRHLDYFLNGSYAISIGLVIFLIYSLDHPLMGKVSVSHAPFATSLKLMDHVDQADAAIPTITPTVKPR